MVILNDTMKLHKAAYQILFDADNSKTAREGSGSFDVISLVIELCSKHPDLPYLQALGNAVKTIISATPDQIIEILNQHDRVVIPAGWHCRLDRNHCVYLALERLTSNKNQYSISIFNLGLGVELLQKHGFSQKSNLTIEESSQRWLAKGVIYQSGFKTPHIFIITPASLPKFLASLLAPLNAKNPDLENFQNADTYYHYLIKIMLAYLEPNPDISAIKNQLQSEDVHHAQRSGTCSYKSFAAAIPAILPEISQKPREIHAVKTSLKIACLAFLKSEHDKHPNNEQYKLDYLQACLRVSQRLSKPMATTYAQAWHDAITKLLPTLSTFPNAVSNPGISTPITQGFAENEIPTAPHRIIWQGACDPTLNFSDTPESDSETFKRHFFEYDREEPEETINDYIHITKLLPATKNILSALHNDLTKSNIEQSITNFISGYVDISHDIRKSHQITCKITYGFIWDVFTQVDFLLKCLQAGFRSVNNKNIKRGYALYVYIFYIDIYLKFALHPDACSGRPTKLTEVGYLDPLLIEIQGLCQQICQKITEKRPVDFHNTVYFEHLPDEEITQWHKNKFHQSLEIYE
jgi:hypothetical protein